jgi:CheY-like chemotaxis protein
MNILIADDDKNFGYILKSELEGNGYSVDLVCDGVEAVMKFIDGRFNFVLFDIKMPNLDGINALRIIKKLNPDIQAITFSGSAGSGEMAESLKAGALRCLTKPFEVRQVKDELRKHSARHTGV